MAEDKWADAHNALTRALDQAKEAGLTKDEVDDAVDDAYTDVPYVPGPPKKNKKASQLK
jgi:hypothetical protein